MLIDAFRNANAGLTCWCAAVTWSIGTILEISQSARMGAQRLGVIWWWRSIWAESCCHPPYTPFTPHTPFPPITIITTIIIIIIIVVVAAMSFVNPPNFHNALHVKCLTLRWVAYQPTVKRWRCVANSNVDQSSVQTCSLHSVWLSPLPTLNSVTSFSKWALLIFSCTSNNIRQLACSQVKLEHSHAPDLCPC